MNIRRNPYNPGMTLFKQHTQFDTEFIDNFTAPAGTYEQRNRSLIIAYTGDAKDLFREAAALLKKLNAAYESILGFPLVKCSADASRLCNRFLTAYMVCEYHDHNAVFAQHYDFQLLLKVKHILKGLDFDFDTAPHKKLERTVMWISTYFEDIATDPLITSLYK